MVIPTRRIVVGVDGSRGAERALRWAAGVARPLGAEVVAVHALGLLAHLGEGTVPSQSHRDELHRQLERHWTRALEAAGVDHRCVLADGNPVTALLSVARELGAELVVVGSRGVGGYPGLELGSTSRQLVEHTDRPVVVVPDPTSETEG